MSRNLPSRYQVPLRGQFESSIFEKLTAGCSVLDIGSGRHPAVRAEDRPADVRYVGLDLSRDELLAAGPAAYTESVEADATSLQPDLVDRFDLVVSWQVLEHVQDLELTLNHIHRYLKPGGRFVAQFSGAWSAFGVINRILPNKIGAKVVDRTMKRTENNIPVFPAYYDRCNAKALERMLAGWSSHTLVPFYFGAGYFNFFPPLQKAYLVYENAIERSDRRNLATHYLISADR